MIQTHGLHHIHLVVRDLQRSVGFYTQVFGMEEQFRVGPHMVFLSTPGSRDLITLHQDSNEAQRAGESGGIAHFGFQLVDPGAMDAAVAEIERGGGTLLSRGEHAPGVPFVYITDPDGYVIELGNP